MDGALEALEVMMALNGIVVGATFALQDNVPGYELVEPGRWYTLQHGEKPIDYGIHIEGFRNHPTYNVLVGVGLVVEPKGVRGLLWVSDKDLGDKYWL